MPQLLTTNAQIKCAHTGTGTVASPSAPLMTINGGTVLVQGDNGTIAGCLLVNAPCMSFTLQSMGYNSTTIDSRPAILVTDFQKTNTFLPLFLTETHTTYDDSTPAPLPAGGAAPPLSAEMLDVVPPIVVAVPPAGVFSHTTQLPPLVVFVFTISSAFPKSWILSHVSAAGATDVTSGGIPGPLVAPSGGDWASPVDVITVTLTTAFLNSLPSGPHYFYLTAVSKRGIPATTAAILTVA
jgi:hypothetical protein